MAARGEQEECAPLQAGTGEHTQDRVQGRAWVHKPASLGWPRLAAQGGHHKVRVLASQRWRAEVT